MVTPEEALLQEFGIDPNEVVGQAASEAGGPKRNITAIEAMRARLDELSQPLKAQKQAEKALPSISRDAAKSLLDEIEPPK